MQAISSLGKNTSFTIPWLKVKETSDAALIVLPIPDFELDVHLGAVPGEPGASFVLFGIIVTFFINGIPVP